MSESDENCMSSVDVKRALDILRKQSEVLGITNPTLQSAVVVGIDAIEQTIWHNELHGDHPSDGDVIVGKTGEEIGLYRYSRVVGYLRIGDQSGKKQVSCPVEWWKAV